MKDLLFPKSHDHHISLKERAQPFKSRPARARIKQYADKKRSERSFEEGDLVFLKLHPYTQQSIEHRRNHKLSARYFAPDQIIKVGAAAYQLALPEGSKIPPVFHVSLLKKSWGILLC